jgi:hypothetical protein
MSSDEDDEERQSCWYVFTFDEDVIPIVQNEKINDNHNDLLLVTHYTSSPVKPDPNDFIGINKITACDKYKCLDHELSTRWHEERGYLQDERFSYEHILGEHRISRQSA